MSENSKSHAVSQTACAGADGKFYAIWEMAYVMKGFKGPRWNLENTLVDPLLLVQMQQGHSL